MVSKRLMSLVLVLVTGASAGAGTYSGSVEYTVGSGSNEATIVIDFDFGESFLFTYRWDGEASGWDALDAIDQAGALDVTATDYGPVWGVFVSDFNYPGGSEYYYGPGANTGWAYYISDDNTNWSLSGSGVSFRTLSNGAWDSWVWSDYPADWSGPLRRPGQRPVPEHGYQFDGNDFAIEVVDYDEGDGAGTYNEPNSALGRPSLETGGLNYPDMELVVPVFQPWLTDQLVRIGGGGQLTVRFSHPVANDENNPYGIDFVIFGNAFLMIGDGQYWDFGNPEDTIVNGVVASEPGIVSVSRDGVSWYRFDSASGPWADTFAPTASYEWDSVNDVWGMELDPTRPIDPNLRASDLAGRTVAEVIETYDGSAGGTGFDIGVLGLDWIQYVRIEDDPNSGVTTEIDAIADVGCCGDYRHPYPVGDINRDCRVDMKDMSLLGRYWLDCTWDCP